MRIATGEIDDTPDAPLSAAAEMHKTLRMTPAMAAGVSDKLWSVGDIVDLIEAQEAVTDGSLVVG